MKFFKKPYCDSIRKHYESYFREKGIKKKWTIEVFGRLPPDFYILEIKPNKIHNMWVYLTVGMSINTSDEHQIELMVYSGKQNESIVELLTLNASYHRNNEPLNIHHTVNIGQPWLGESICDYGFVSRPYLDGEKLELFKFDNKIIHCYWLIPITKLERDFKIKKGYESLEKLFEDKQIDYLNPNRKCLIES